MGQMGGLKVVFLMAFSSAFFAGSMMGEWKAPLTGSGRIRLAPASLSRVMAVFMAVCVPDMTSCPGQL